MHHFRDIESEREEGMFTFMPNDIIIEGNRDPRLYIRVPWVSYPTTDYLSKYKSQPVDSTPHDLLQSLPKQKSQSSINVSSY